MKKRVWLVVVCVMALMFGTIWTVHAEIISPKGPGQIGLDAVVLCESLSVRNEPSSSSRAVQKLSFGAHMMVIKEKNGWAQIMLSDAVDAEPAGWVNEDYIVVDPSWYKTEDSTPVYAWNDKNAPKVALLDKGTKLPILKDEGGWLCVSLRGATGWIKK